MEYARTDNWSNTRQQFSDVAETDIVKVRVKVWMLYDPCGHGTIQLLGSSRRGSKAVAREQPGEAAKFSRASLVASRSRSRKYRSERDRIGSDLQRISGAPIPPGCGDPFSGTPNPTAATLDILDDITGDTDPNQLNVFYVRMRARVGSGAPRMTRTAEV